MFDWDDGNRMIADHCNQGFDGIRSCSAGTKARLVTPNGTSTYTCAETIYDGWNTSGIQEIILFTMTTHRLEIIIPDAL